MPRLSFTPSRVRPSVGLATALLATALVLCGCEIDSPPGARLPNRPPSIQITHGAVEGQNADYRTEFFWFGADEDGFVDHFLYAIDDTCLCRYEVDRVVPGHDGPVVITDWRESIDPDSCRAHGLEPLFESATFLWTRTEDFSGRFLFQATTPIDTAEVASASDWHTFHVKSVDDRGGLSRADSRRFNAVTIAPSAWLEVPVGNEIGDFITIGEFIAPRWKGHDFDTPGKLPVGYQLKLVELDSPYDDNALTILYFTHEVVAKRNLLIHDTLLVENPEDVTHETYLPTDWWPKRDALFRSLRLPLENLENSSYAFAVRAVDRAGAVTPDRGLAIATQTERGSIVKLDVNPNIPGGPYVTLIEPGLGERVFRGVTEEWRVEVPAGVPIQFEWTVDASHYGTDPGPVNYALDLSDPGCELCTDPDGISGWAGWSRNGGMRQPIVFSRDDAEEQHVLYILARDAGFTRERETLAVVVIDVIGFSLNQTALWVDDFKWAGVNDCTHDSTLAIVLEAAIEPYLDVGEELDVFSTYKPPWPGSEEQCSEVNEPALLPLSRISRYKTIYWNVSATINGSAIGSLSTPSLVGAGKHLHNYVGAGGNLIVWGRRVYGALLGDFYPQTEPWLPAIPANTDPNFGPGSFVWDVLKLRTRLDWVGRRGDIRNLDAVCSGVLGLEATELAIEEGYPVGEVDPTGYDPTKTAIWYDFYEGERNRSGARGASGPVGVPPVLVAGLDTLYTYISNSWTYARGGQSSIRDACGTAFLSPFEGDPIVLRSRDPIVNRGKVVVIGTPLVYFMERSPTYIGELFKKLTEWVFES